MAVRLFLAVEYYAYALWCPSLVQHAEVTSAFSARQWTRPGALVGATSRPMAKHPTQLVRYGDKEAQIGIQLAPLLSPGKVSRRALGQARRSTFMGHAKHQDHARPVRPPGSPAQQTKLPAFLARQVGEADPVH